MELRGKMEEAPSTPPSPLIPCSSSSLPLSFPLIPLSPPLLVSPLGASKQRRRHGLASSGADMEWGGKIEGVPWSRQAAGQTWSGEARSRSCYPHHPLPSYPVPVPPLPPPFAAPFFQMEQASGGADMEWRGKIEELLSTPPSPLVPRSRPSPPSPLRCPLFPDGAGKRRGRHGVERQDRGAAIHTTLSPRTPFPSLPSLPPSLPPFSRWSRQAAGQTWSGEARSRSCYPHHPLPSYPVPVPPLPPPFAAPFFQMEQASGGADMELRGKIEQLRAVSSASVAQTNSSMEQVRACVRMHAGAGRPTHIHGVDF
ncbi:unnamed protein product [Closterium sp. Naga37s-1]|nr:unnamed protein product [Closterium sp. Naga37s-1]